MIPGSASRRFSIALWILSAALLIPKPGLAFCHRIEVARAPLSRVALGNSPAVRIQWFGHSTFQITSSRGTRILTDPHQRDDLPWPTLPQDIVTTSHNHGAHSNIWMARGNPEVLEGLKPDDNWRVIHRVIRDVAVYTVPAYHDKSQGLQRGKNSIFIFRVDDICIAHLGDLGHRLTPQQLQIMGQIDVLLVPLAGGMFTITALEAREVTLQVKPRIAIPMHFWWEGAVESFVEDKLPVKRMNGTTLTIGKAELPHPTQVFVLTWLDP